MREQNAVGGIPWDCLRSLPPPLYSPPGWLFPPCITVYLPVSYAITADKPSSMRILPTTERARTKGVSQGLSVRNTLRRAP